MSALVEAEKANFPVNWMCQQMGVACWSFYAWRARTKQATATQAGGTTLRGDIAGIFHAQRSTTGRRRVAAIPNPMGTQPRWVW